MTVTHAAYPLRPVVTPVNGNAILDRVRLDATHWLVLSEDRSEPDPRYRVGLATANGDFSDDALHVTLESARADFETRRAIHGARE